jgi:amidophosphoribosyltransferase
VKKLYSPFSDEDISAEIARIVTPEDIDWHGEVEVIFLSVENLHRSISQSSGDWYFTGDYPTVGGYSVVNRAFLHWREGKAGRSYDLPL